MGAGLADHGYMVPAAAPAAAGISGGREPLQAALGLGAFDSIKIAISQEYLGRAIDGVLFAGKIRVAEPQRPPTSIGPLLGGEVIHAVPYGLVDRTVRNPILPRMQGPQGMGGQVGAAAVERCTARTTAEGGPTAVVVLHGQEPVDACGGGDLDPRPMGPRAGLQKY